MAYPELGVEDWNLKMPAICLIFGPLVLVNSLYAVEKAAGQPRPKGFGRESVLPVFYHRDQLEYRAQLNAEIIKLGQLLFDGRPQEIPYLVWLCDHDPVKRRRLIGNDVEHDLLQNFYTALQNRYDYQKQMVQPDAKFSELNQACIANYNIVMLKVDF